MILDSRCIFGSWKQLQILRRCAPLSFLIDALCTLKRAAKIFAAANAYGAGLG
jgi:hypothetical protein